jgi:hypothetical protein
MATRMRCRVTGRRVAGFLPEARTLREFLV